MLIPVAARFKAWVFGPSLAGIAGSNPTGDTDVCLLWALCVVRSGCSFVQRSPTDCVVSECDREVSIMRPWPTKEILHYSGTTYCCDGGESPQILRYVYWEAKPAWKGPLGRPRHRWEDNMKRDLKGIGRDAIGCVHFSQESHISLWKQYWIFSFS
jgi:hypothetical protein